MRCGKFLDKITIAGGDGVAVLAVLRAHAHASRTVAHGNRLAQGLGSRFRGRRVLVQARRRIGGRRV